jgi:hypothetical protein
VDVMVGPPGAATPMRGVRVVAADLARPDGSGHDPTGLAEVLRILT